MAGYKIDYDTSVYLLDRSSEAVSLACKDAQVDNDAGTVTLPLRDWLSVLYISMAATEALSGEVNEDGQ